MKATDDIHPVTNGPFPSWSASERLQQAAGRWIAVLFEFDGRDIEVMYDVVESLDWRNVTFGCTIEATIRCRDISDLVTLRLVDPGAWRLEWHPEEFTASSHPCRDHSGLIAFVDDFTPDATVELVGNALVEFADSDVLEQFVLACDMRRNQFLGACTV